jgi:predicted RNA binding protein YcfA (HicA-like mRNA interferase family)
MSVKRRDLVKYLEQNGFSLLREGKKHSIYTKGERTIPVKRHRTLDRIACAAAACHQERRCED